MHKHDEQTEKPKLIFPTKSKSGGQYNCILHWNKGILKNLYKLKFNKKVDKQMFNKRKPWKTNA